MIQTAGRGLYLHIPFCHRRCHFCAFYLEIHQAARLLHSYHRLLTEIRSYGAAGRFGDGTVGLVYFGGGNAHDPDASPIHWPFVGGQTHLRPGSRCRGDGRGPSESVTADGLAQLTGRRFQQDQLRGGINGPARMYCGSDARLGPEHRRHCCLRAKGGVYNINLDLMYGLPGPDIKSWAASLRQTIDLAPTHLSCYALTIEEGTTLRMSIQRGTVPAPDEDLQNAMDNLAEEILNESGYGRYEISNYSRPGYACRHNRLHWTGGQYLGLGTERAILRRRSARRQCERSRLLHPGARERSASSGGVRTTGARSDDSCERLVLGLRMIDGVSLERTEPWRYQESFGK